MNNNGSTSCRLFARFFKHTMLTTPNDSPPSPTLVQDSGRGWMSTRRVNARLLFHAYLLQMVMADGVSGALVQGEPQNNEEFNHHARQQDHQYQRDGEAALATLSDQSASAGERRRKRGCPDITRRWGRRKAFPRDHPFDVATSCLVLRSSL